MALMTSFVLGMKGLTEGFTALPFLYYYHRGTQANGVIHGDRQVWEAIE